MKRSLVATLTILLVLSVIPASAQRWVERHSTDPERDLDRVSFAGKITKIEGQVAYIRTVDGEMMHVQLGPRWYWHERGYRLRTGIEVEVSGWYEDDDETSCFAGYISGNGFHFELTNSNGYPLWADPDNYYDDYYPRVHRYETYYYNPPRYIPRWWNRPYYYNRPFWNQRYWNRHWDRHWNHPPRYNPPHHPPRHDPPRHNPPPRPQEHREGRRRY